MDEFLRDSDAFSWYMEKDPILRSTVVAIAWLESSPPWELLVERLDEATRIVPVFRKRVIEVPARLANPRWTLHDEFDLTSHVRRIDAPEPRSNQTVLEFARHAAMTGFDRTRPLWEFTLIEHMEGEHAALVMKLHHSLTDGVGGMQLALLLFDRRRDGDGDRPGADDPGGEVVTSGVLLRESFVHDWDRFSGLLYGGVKSAVPSVLSTLRYPMRSVASGVGTVGSIARTVAPVRKTLSPVMKRRGLGRKLDMLEVGLDDLKLAASKANGTVNDGFLAAVTGGMRLYHERHGASVDSLRVTLPISIRRPEDPIGGNRITLIRFLLPVSDPDPVSRMERIDDSCRRAREERSLPFTDAIAGGLNLLPRGFVGGMLKHVDFLASDVPGFPFPVYLGGALVERYVSFGPTIGSATNLTLLSYNGICSVGVTTDSAAVPDHEVLVDCLRRGFEEVLDLAGPHRPTRLPLEESVLA